MSKKRPVGRQLVKRKGRAMHITGQKRVPAYRLSPEAAGDTPAPRALNPPAKRPYQLVQLTDGATFAKPKQGSKQSKKVKARASSQASEEWQAVIREANAAPDGQGRARRRRRGVRRVRWNG